MPQQPMPDLVILIPGILGSVLKRGDRVLWSTSRRGLLQVVQTRGAITEQLAEDFAADEEIIPHALIPDTHLIPGFWKIDGYTRIRKQLRAAFKLDQGSNYWEFPYDWRLDNRHTANLFQRFCQEKLTHWRQQSGNRDAKLIILAHSMGGLVSRYFLEVLEGWKITRLLVTFGTPFRGSIKALNFISNGFHKQIRGVTLFHISEALRKLTSVYQLLPTYPCFEQSSKMLRLSEARAIPGLESQKITSARLFHDEIARHITTNLKQEAYRNMGYRLHSVVGVGQDTPQMAKLEHGTLVTLNTYGTEIMDGDGTVPRVSATPYDKSNAPDEIYVGDRHASLQNSDGVLLHILGMLKSQNLSLFRFRGNPMKQANLNLIMDDAYSDTEPQEITVRTSDEIQSLYIAIYDVESNKEVGYESMNGESGCFRYRGRPLPPGTYRVIAHGPGTRSVTDVMVVFPSL